MMKKGSGKLPMAKGKSNSVPMKQMKGMDKSSKTGGGKKGKASCGCGG